MKLHTKCANCKSEAEFRKVHATRVTLAMAEGDFISVKCKKCGALNQPHVDEVYAKYPGTKLILVGGVLFVVSLMFVLVPLLVYQTNMAGLGFAKFMALPIVPVVVYGIYQREKHKQVSAFNKHKLKGYVSSLNYHNIRDDK